MSSAVSRRGAGVLCALLAALVIAYAPVRAADSAAADAKPARSVKVKKPRATPAAHAPAPAVVKVAKAKPAPRPKPAPKSREEQVKEDGPWASQTNWLCLRAGYAKSTALNSGDGLGGYGMSFQHMLGRRWSFGGAVQHDLLGRLGSSSEVSVPFTLELARHFKWSPSLRPYVGVGAGYYFHKYYRTSTDDTGAPGMGTYVSLGFNTPLNSHQILGLDTRMSFVKGRDGVINPVFGPETANETLWSIKLSWGLVY